jgi:phosphoribosylformylglycinamidine synthase
VAHGEGKFLPEGGETGLSVLESQKRVALRYVATDGGPPSFPANPNGSIGNVAGLIDASGRVFGLMPHPERNVQATQSPDRMRAGAGAGDGRRVFERAVGLLA